MGIFSWLFSKAAGGVIEATGTAITKVVRVTHGDKAAVQEHVHDEQMAVLAEQAAEFVSRPTRTKFDSFVDGLNRLPRPLIVLWVCAFFVWPFFSPDSFLRYVLSMELIPEPLWTLFLGITIFYFGGRVLSQDIKPPRLSKEQRDYALRQIEKREEAIIEAKTPLIVERAPDRKPPAPAWTLEIARPDPIPLPPKLPDIINQPNSKGRSEAVDRMIGNLLQAEGGMVDHPADRGGATNHGITIGTLEAWRGRECTVDDVKALTEEEATEIYLKNYFYGPSIDGLPIELQAHVLDIGVNSGPGTAIKMLQRVLNSMGEDLKIDAIIGELTRQACARHPAKDINNNLVKARLKFYNDIIKKDPSQGVFKKGWTKRANSFKVA